jgi:hypothetical protein
MRQEGERRGEARRGRHRQEMRGLRAVDVIFFDIFQTELIAD